MKNLISCLLLVGLLLGCQGPRSSLDVVDEMEIERFLGRWHEVASFPQRFQEGCTSTTADYALREDGRIDVVNTCRDGTLDGRIRRVEGVAWVNDPKVSNAKLKVQFFWPFSGDYWVIDLDPEYRYAVIGHPSRDYLWVLSRTRTLAPPIYEEILVRIESQGYDLSGLERTMQPRDP